MPIKTQQSYSIFSCILWFVYNYSRHVSRLSEIRDASAILCPVRRILICPPTPPAQGAASATALIDCSRHNVPPDRVRHSFELFPAIT